MLFSIDVDSYFVDILICWAKISMKTRKSLFLNKQYTVNQFVAWFRNCVIFCFMYSHHVERNISWKNRRWWLQTFSKFNLGR